eukprot:s488_g2.t1
MLVPSFDPAVDNVDIWSSKVTLLLEAWPQNKIIELITRLILNTKGSAYQKLHLHQKDLLVNDRKGVQKLVELVGGTWGQVPLEHRFELVEKALYRCQQKADETGDSFIARVDVIWTELLTKSITLDQLQAYVLLRGSRLTADDKKRVLVESGAETAGNKLEWSKVVSAIRMLGSAFFQDYTGAKRERSLKTYDHMAFNVDEVDDEPEHDAYWVSDDPLDDDTLAQLVNENDEDAAMVVQFEDAIAETIQNDSDLATFFSSYQDARRRLTERAKFRGFWPVKKGFKGSGKKGTGKGNGKGKTLAQRIANSTCRLCGKKGHWKAECSLRNSSNPSTAPSETSTVPISLAVVDQIPADMPPEIFHLPEMSLDESLHDTSFKEFSKSQKTQIDKEVVSTMTLKELAGEKVTFGDAKKGQTVAQAFEDQKWTEFIVNRFEDSKKPEHMMFIQYIRLRLEEDKKNPIKSSKPMPTKPATKEMPPVPQDVWEELEHVEGSSEAEMHMSFVQEEMQDLRQSNQSLSNRMGQVEMMHEILEHMRKMQVKSEG